VPLIRKFLSRGQTNLNPPSKFAYPDGMDGNNWSRNLLYDYQVSETLRQLDKKFYCPYYEEEEG
jgi:hypothetical protein